MQRRRKWKLIAESRRHRANHAKKKDAEKEKKKKQKEAVVFTKSTPPKPRTTKNSNNKTNTEKDTNINGWMGSDPGLEEGNHVKMGLVSKD